MGWILMNEYWIHKGTYFLILACYVSRLIANTVTWLGMVCQTGELSFRIFHPLLIKCGTFYDLVQLHLYLAHVLQWCWWFSLWSCPRRHGFWGLSFRRWWVLCCYVEDIVCMVLFCHGLVYEGLLLTTLVELDRALPTCGTSLSQLKCSLST